MNAAYAETWTHVFRNTDAKISETDSGPYDEYLDTAYIAFEGEWTLIRTKSVLDDPGNEFHGKLELSTWAISCRQYKVGIKDHTVFRDLRDVQPAYRQTATVEEIEPYARNLLLLNKDAVMTVQYPYACLGVPPDRWAEMKEKMFPPK